MQVHKKRQDVNTCRAKTRTRYTDNRLLCQTGKLIRRDGELDGWMEGWMDGWMDGYIDAWMDQSMYGWTDVEVEG